MTLETYADLFDTDLGAPAASELAEENVVSTQKALTG